MFEVVVSGSFRATHGLRLADGSREALHEHIWNVRVTCRGAALDECGMLVDFTLLRPRLDAIMVEIEGREIASLPAFGKLSPTAENVARHIADRLAEVPEIRDKLSCVEVEEEPGCFARYYPTSR